MPIFWDKNPGLCTRRTEFVTVVLTDVSLCCVFQFLASWVVGKTKVCFSRGVMMAVICYRKRCKLVNSVLPTAVLSY